MLQLIRRPFGFWMVLAVVFCFALGAAAQVSTDLFSGLQWRNVGPYHGGRIAAVTGAIGEPGTFYVGLPQGGIWKTTSGGMTWYPVFDQVTEVDSIGAIQVAPSNPNIVYAGYGIALGPLFGLINGLAHGITLGGEFSRIARQKPDPGFWFDLVMSAIRGCGYGLGTAFLFGAKFGITFGALSTIGQIIGYQLGIRPSATYPASTRPRMTGLLFLGVLNRAVGYSIAGYLSSLVGNQHARAWALGIEAGLLVGLVSAVAVFWMPFIEWSADHMPARRMGVLGVVLIVIGFALQSVQYWTTLLGPRTN